MCVEQVGHLNPVFFIKIVNYIPVLNRSSKSMIIGHTIKFGNRKWEINVKDVFLKLSHRGHQMYCPLNNAMLRPLVSYVMTNFVSHNIL